MDVDRLPALVTTAAWAMIAMGVAACIALLSGQRAAYGRYAVGAGGYGLGLAGVGCLTRLRPLALCR